MKKLILFAIVLLVIPFSYANVGFNGSSDSNGGGWTTIDPLNVTLENIQNEHASSRANQAYSSGKYYFEIDVIKRANGEFIGLGNNQIPLNVTSVASNSGFWGLRLSNISNNGYKVNGEGEPGLSYCESLNANDGSRLMIAADFDNNKIWFGVDGTWCNSGNPSEGTNPAYSNLAGELFPAIGTSSSGTKRYGFNFTVNDYDLPIGFELWQTVINEGVHSVQINSEDLYDGTSISNFSISISNSTNIFNFTTGNGTIHVDNRTIEDFDVLYDVKFSSNQSGGYFNQTYYGVNITNENSILGQLYQSIFSINATDSSGNKIADFFASIENQGNQSKNGIATLLVKAGQHTIIGNKTGNKNSSIIESISALENKSVTLVFTDASLRIDAYSISEGIFIDNFSIYIFNSTTIIGNRSTTTGNVTFGIGSGDYSVIFTSDDYATQHENITIPKNTLFPNETIQVYTTNSFNLSVYDEIFGLSDVNFFNGKTVNVELVSEALSKNFTTTTGELYADLIVPSDYRLTLSSVGYKNRDYYFTLNNNTNSQIDAYLLSLSNSTDVEVTVQDGSGNKLEDAEVRLKRYYVDTNSYVTVAMARTDFEGTAILDVDFDDAFYQLQAIYQTFSTQSQGSKIFNTEITITLGTSINPFTEIDVGNDVSTSLTFNNQTQTYSYTFTSLSGTERQGTIEVYEYSGIKNNLICSNTVSSSSATLLCVANVSNSNSTFIANGYINSLENEERILTATLEKSNELKDKFLGLIGDNGLFLSILFAGTTAGLGLANPAIAVVLFLTGLMSMIFIGFGAIPISFFFTICIFGFLVIWRLRG